MATDRKADAGAIVVNQWIAGMCGAVEFMTGAGAKGAWTTTDVWSGSAPDDLCWSQSFSIAPDAPLSIRASQNAWREFGARVLRASGLDEADEAAIRSTYLEVLTQALASAAKALGENAQLQVELGTGTEDSGEAVAGAAVYSVLFRFDEGGSADVDVAVPAALIRALQPKLASTGAYSTADDGSRGCIGMDRLLDVELPVTISFGKTLMPLKTILKLTTGSIIELDRALHEHVDVLVNNSIVARGEVVVVDGNYGVRIHQIVSREERLALRAPTQGSHPALERKSA